jgi:hypothetical protein
MGARLRNRRGERPGTPRLSSIRSGPARAQIANRAGGTRGDQQFRFAAKRHRGRHCRCSCSSLNGDGKADLIAVDDNATFVMLSNGSGFGSVQGWSGRPFYGTVGTCSGDVNGDGKSDLIALNYDPGN